MPRLPSDALAALDRRLANLDDSLRATYPGPVRGRTPIHTVYVPAHKVRPDLCLQWGEHAIEALAAHPPLPFPEELRARVEAKLAREPIEDLRLDFEDGYGVREESEEDEAVRAVVAAVHTGPQPPFLGLRCKSLEAPTRRRAVRTLDLFLDEWLRRGALPDAFVITLPKVSAVAQVEAMVDLCGRLEEAYGLAAGALRFELQVETPPAVLGADGTATVARMIHVSDGRCAGLHYGTYDYSAACGIAAPYQSMDHPVADHAKAVMIVAAAGTGVRVSDGSTNVLPVGDTAAVHAAWRLHARLVRRSLERGLYQGWDLHPAQLPTRYAVTYGFFREGRSAAVARLSTYLHHGVAGEAPGASVGVLDEPATARALAGFLLRGLYCGAFDEHDVDIAQSTLEAL